MPIGAVNSAGKQVIHLLRRLKEELKVNTTCGASNVSFGLPNSNGINGAFIAMSMAAGLTSAITNPLHEPEMAAIMGANIYMGKDPNCRLWITKFREPTCEGTGGRRETRRRRA